MNVSRNLQKAKRRNILNNCPEITQAVMLSATKLLRESNKVTGLCSNKFPRKDKDQF